MWDDSHEKEMARNQALAIVLMGLLMVGWYVFFLPQTNPPVEPDSRTTAATAAVPDERSASGTAPAAPTTPAPAGDEHADLPPVATQEDPAADEVTLHTPNLELAFTRVGARLKRAHVLPSTKHEIDAELVPPSYADLDAESVYPLGIRFGGDEIRDALDYRRYEYREIRDGVEFSLEIPGRFIVIKQFERVPEHPHMIRVRVTISNESGAPLSLGEDLTPAYVLNWGPGMQVVGEGRYFPPNVVYRPADAAKAETVRPDKLPGNSDIVDGRLPGLQWIGYKSKYFMAAFKPDDRPVADGWAQQDGEGFRFGLFTPSFEIPEGATHTTSYLLYMGPMHLDSLRNAWPGLPSALRFFDWEWMEWFSKILLRNLNWWYGIIPNYGVAIILLTLLVRAVMFPLTLKQIRSMKRMSQVAPELKELQEKYKDDQQEMSRKMMELYRERGINPLAGCFPLILQMPVFFALYRMLWNTYELRGANFLWINDLSQPDCLFAMPFMTSIPFVGQYLACFNLLPLLVTAAMVINMKLTPTAGMQNEQQKMIMTMMPIMFGVIAYPFSAGLNLYVLTSTLFGIVQHRVITKTEPPEKSQDNAKDKPRGKPKDKPKAKPLSKRKKESFYARAKARQRERDKAIRKARKKKA